MEDKFLVAKTLLACYSHLDDLYGSLTARAEACVRDGFYAIFPKEQMRLYERIIEFEARKVCLYNMKFLIEECFRKGTGDRLSLLKEKYIDMLSKEELIAKYGVSLRTCYRHLRKGIEEFTAELEKMGFDKKKLLLTFGNDPLFQNMLSKVIREDDREEADGEGTASAVIEQAEVSRRNTPHHPVSSGLVHSAPDRSGRGHPCA